MVRVQKFNVILDIDEDSLDKYMSQGYDQIDVETGAVIKEAIPQDIGILRRAFVENKKQIDELKEEVAKLKKSAKKQSSTTKS